MEIHIKTVSTNLGWHFTVTIDDPAGPSFHKVSMDKDFLTRVGADHHPEKVVKKSFEFLLEKEPKERILPEFDITEISTFYPNFISELNKRLAY
jgi:hypothetical protein